MSFFRQAGLGDIQPKIYSFSSFPKPANMAEVTLAEPHRTPYGFIPQTRDDEQKFKDMMATDITPEELTTTLVHLKETFDRISARSDYCLNAKLTVAITKNKDGELGPEVFYTNNPAEGKAAQRLYSKDWVSAIFRDSKFTLLEEYGNFEMDSDFRAKTVEESKLWLNAERDVAESDLPAEIIEHLESWFTSLFKFQFEEYFAFKEKLDSENPNGRTADALRAECVREGQKMKQAQPVVRNMHVPGAKFMHLPFQYKTVSAEKLGEISKRFKTADLTVSRAKALERISASWEHALANRWFYGFEKADGTSGPEELLMQQFHEKCVEAVSTARKTAIACGFHYIPVVDRDRIELSAASRRAIQENSGSNIFFVEYQTPLPIGETNICLYPKTIYWLGRLPKKTGITEERRVI